ncbi:MAG: hybrid sensor histidine kinase/response regulator [Candidatus Kapaibacterium sp.]
MNSFAAGQKYKPIIMIVDDIPENLQVLGSSLDMAGYETAFATNGHDALEAISEVMPDLILLDVSMPDIDGFEVCRQLKATPATAEIPIIFLTAHTDVEHIVHAFSIGAGDYIAKPFQQAELLARVSVHLEVSFSRRRLAEQNHFLMELNREKNELLEIAAHDLKNPLQGVIFAAANGRRYNNRQDIQAVDSQLIIIEKSVGKMLGIIKTLLDAREIESGSLEFHREKIPVREITAELKESFLPLSYSKFITLTFTDAPHTSAVYADRLRTIEVLDNLLSNALKFSPRDTNVYVTVTQVTRLKSDFIRFEVRDEGPGLTEEDQKSLFQRFARLSARPTGNESSTGLGLSIAKKLVDMMGGRIYCESQPEQGAVFVVELPAAY